MRVVLLGATKGMGRALARRMAKRGDRLCLLGRNLEELARSASDLEVRGANGRVGVVECDLERPETFAQALSRAETQLDGPLGCVVVSAAMFARQEQLETDTALTHRLLTVDFTNTILFCEHARRQLMMRRGTLCVFSSVAGERGRKPVVLYGAAKAGLSAYLEGLDHKYRSQGLVTVCVKPGFVRTSMTAGLEAPPFAGDPDRVAARVLAAIDRGNPVVYVPPIWGLVACVIRLLPRAVMRRIGF